MVRTHIEKGNSRSADGFLFKKIFKKPLPNELKVLSRINPRRNGSSGQKRT